MIRHLTRTAFATLVLAIATPAIAQPQPPPGSSQPQPRDRRTPMVDLSVTLAAYPTTAPPAPRPEGHGPGRRGMMWIDGHWDWRGGAWDWTAGTWQRDQPSRRRHAGEWQQRDNRWEWRADSWEDVPAYPNAAPPPPQAENPGRGRTGMIWAEGRWDWQRGDWAWVPGRWLAPRRGLELRAGAWEPGGDHWQWRADAWVDLEHDQPALTAASHGPAPRMAPPAAPSEIVPPARNGYVWAGGRYRWTGASYEWVGGQWRRQQAARIWIDGRWERHGRRYAWRDGRWETPARRLR